MVQSLIQIGITAINKKALRYFIVFICLVANLGGQNAPGQVISKNDPQSIVLANNRAYWLYNHGRYNESIAILKNILQQQDNVISNFLLGCIYNTEQNYPEAVKYCERTEKLDTSFHNVYGQLFTAYYGTERWADAQRVSEKAAKYGKNNDTEAMLQVIDFALRAEFFSKLMVILFLITLAGVFFYPVYSASKNGSNFLEQYKDIRFSEVILICASISCILWTIFFSLSKWIWSFNPPIHAEDVVNYARGGIFEHDGIQNVTLYGMMFINLATSLLATTLVIKLKRNANLYNTVFTILLLVTAYYLFRIGFFPPLCAIEPMNVFLPALLAVLSVGIYLLYHKKRILAICSLILLAAFTGFIQQGPASTVDFIYLLSPALRFLHGFKIQDIYFQYDLYTSLLLALWIKLKFTIDYYPYLGQFSFFLLFLGALFFGDGFFKNKGLSVFFIIGFILVRYYTIWADNPEIIQVTPLRLDLWMILLLIAARKGFHHWLMGIFMGLLIIFHRNLGILYFGAYVELVLMMFLIDVFGLARAKNISVKSISATFIRHLKLTGLNLALVAASVAIIFILFHEMFSASTLQYVKLRIMMKPISRVSFYWYITILLGSLISFIYYFRNRLGERYVSTALFVVFLVIANSMYFYGRSHENNILNISGLLAIAVFVLFDILIFLSPAVQKTAPAQAPLPPPAKSKKRPNAPAVDTSKKQPDIEHTLNARFIPSVRMAYWVLPVVFIFLVGYAYSVRITEKVKLQYSNLSDKTLAFPFPALPIDTASVREMTHNSKKVYVIDFWYDSYYFYYNDYAPQGVFSPCQSWIFKKDLVPFLQGLLDQGYYIAFDIREYNRYVEYFELLNYNQTDQKNVMVTISKTDVPKLLPNSSTDLLHIASKDTLATCGLDYSPIKMKDSFSVEVIFKAFDNQMPNATLIENLSSFDGNKGFTLRLNANNQNQFVFGFSNGSNVMPNNVFPLEYNKWHYIAITENNQTLKIYDNGKLITNMSSGGLPIVNTENDVTIGNQVSLNSQFRGYIREVKISNGNISEAEILNNFRTIETNLK